ncbi:hypothetical protein HSBAA_PA_2840 (plasmid) [Vreelandella sulfidaeris]|uniref:Uncharacterized protein n=1 Tax=Vreelandella sulfidaeris TaxID=115553 RepID=A0A455UM00_9GAMM|nr:hypothetical protein HSBAA_PA_2840 [Halomonas sulfidaeris]
MRMNALADPQDLLCVGANSHHGIVVPLVQDKLTPHPGQVCLGCLMTQAPMIHSLDRIPLKPHQLGHMLDR